MLLFVEIVSNEIDRNFLVFTFFCCIEIGKRIVCVDFIAENVKDLTEPDIINTPARKYARKYARK